MDVTIRALGADDTHAVLSLYREAVLAVPTGTFTPAMLNEWASRPADEFVHQNAGRARFVAEIGNMIVGYTGFDSLRSILTECYVFPSQQKRGIGRRLVSHVIALAKNSGLERLEVLASANAESFYATLGFSVLRPEPMTMADGQILPCIRMARIL